MKRLFLSVVLAASLTAAPLAYAAPTSPPINDPLTDTLELWSSIAEALSSVGRDLASAFTSLELAVNKSAGNSSAQEPATPAVAVASFGPQQGEPATTSPQTLPPSTASATTTIVNYITSPIERVIDEEPLASNDFVTQEQLTAAIFAVSQQLAPEQTELLPQWVAADGNPTVPYAAENNITNLSGVTISNATISGGSVPSSSLTGTIANAIDTATGEIDTLSGAGLVYTAATTTNATSTNLFASNLAASALSVSGTTTLPILDLSSLNCSTFGNGGKLTTDAFGNVTCAADQGGSGSTIGGSDMEVQFNSGGSFQGSSSFTFASSTDRLTVTNASTTNVTASYASSTNLVVGNATSTNFFASLANLTTGIIGSLSGSQLTYTAASTTNFSDTGTAYFGATATSSFNNAGQLTLANLASAVLGVNSSGQVVATTTIGTNLLTGTLGTINGASLSAGGTITITAASSTLLANNNTWTGLQQFANASSTFETDSTLWLPNTTSVLLKTTGSGQVATAIAGIDYQVPITASYPISFSGNNLSLVFGTTTANTFSQLQTLSGGASTTNLSASGEGYFATASTTNLTVSGSPSGFLQTNAQGIVSATSTFSAGSIFGTLPVGNGGTGSTTLTGILKGNGTGAIQTAVGGTDYEFPLTFSTGLNRTGNTITTTGVLLLGSGYATTTGTTITLSTTTQSFSGLTIAQQITSPNGSDILFTPTISGTLSNAGLAHSTIVLNGITLTLGDSGDAITAASSTLLANNNSWTGLQQFQNASTTLFSAYGPAYFGATATSTFTSTGALNLAGLGTFTSGFVSQASSTVVGNLTLTGTLSAQAGSFTGTTGTTTIASGQGFTVGGSQFVVQQGSGNVGIGTTSPSYPLDVTGTIHVTQTSGNGLSFTGINPYISSNDYLNFYATHDLVFAPGNTESMRIVGSTGNVYMGYTSESNPGELNLQFNSNTAQGLTITNSNGSSFNGHYLLFNNSSNSPIGSVSENNTFVTYNTTSDRRLKQNIATTTAGLATLMQIPVDDFDFINDPTHTQVQGFIAQSLYSIYPEAVTTNGDNGIVPLGPTSTPWEVDYGRITPLIVSAVQDIASISSTFEQNLIAWLGNTENGIAKLFANQVDTQELCLNNSPDDPNPVCVTKTQLAALLSQTASAQTPKSVASSTPQNPTPTSPESVSSATSSASQSATSAGNAATGDSPPQIQINGDNPAIIQVGATYNDLGATIAGPQQDLNLGIKIFVNGVQMSAVQLDTSATATDTIDYVATDQNGLTSTSTRTIIVEAAQTPSIVRLDNSVSTTTPQGAATTTASTS